MAAFPTSCEQSLPERLVELLQLEPGWLDGEGKSFDAVEVAWLRDAWTTHCDGVIPTPYAYPTAEGGIQMEWPLSEGELIANPDLSNQLAEISKIDLGNGKLVWERQFDLGSDDQWSQFAQCLNHATK